MDKAVIYIHGKGGNAEEAICLENSGEVCSHETRLDDFTNLIDIDVIKVILTITAATHPLIFFLFQFHFQ